MNSDSDLFLDANSGSSMASLTDSSKQPSVDTIEQVTQVFDSVIQLTTDHDVLILSASEASLHVSATSGQKNLSMRSMSVCTGASVGGSSTLAESALNESHLPGHLHALTKDQTKSLYHLWHILLNELDHQGHAMGGHLLPQLSLSVVSLAPSSLHASSKSSLTSVGKTSSLSVHSNASGTTKKSMWSFRSKSSKASLNSAPDNDNDNDNDNESKGKISSQSSIQTEPSQEDLCVRIQEPSSDELLGSMTSVESHPHEDPIFKSSSSCPIVSSTTLGSSSTISNSSKTGRDSALSGGGATSDLLIAGHVPMTSYAEELWRGFLLHATDPDAMLLRFLRARKWHLGGAAAMALSTAEWRANSGIFDLLKQGESCCDINLWRSGKTFFYGVDRQDRAVIYIHVRLHDKNASTFADNQKYTLYNMEMARRLLTPGTETCTLVFDMTGFTLANMDYPSTKFLVNCFQSYYPESLAKAYIVSAPWLFNAVWRMIRPWLDPVVASKVFFVKQEELTQFIAPEYLIRSLGGTSSFVYSYTPAEHDSNAMRASVVSLNGISVQSERTQSASSVVSSGIEVASARSASVSLSSDASLLALKKKYLEHKNEFVRLTRKLHALLEPLLTEDDIAAVLKDNETILARRQVLKEQLVAFSSQLDELTLPSNHYQRLGILQPGGRVDWSATRKSNASDLE